MTDLLERAMIAARDLPNAMQDEIARMMLDFAGEVAPIALTLEERSDLDASDEEVLRGEFATDEQMRSIWAKHGA